MTPAKKPRAAAASPPGDPGSSNGMSRRRNAIEGEILEGSARLFAARGFAATSVQDIADTLGMSRPSLYHYFGSKDDILVRLIDGLIESAEHAVADATSRPGTPEERLTRLVSHLITPIAESPGRFRLLLTSGAAFNGADRERVAKLQDSVIGSMSAVIADGVSAGVFRRCDQRVATFAILGMINWVAWWYLPPPDASVDDLCAAISDLAVASLRADRGGRGDQPRAVIASVRRDLQHLDRLLGAD